LPVTSRSETQEQEILFLKNKKVISVKDLTVALDLSGHGQSGKNRNN
jgi:hypothetical protein